MDQWQSTGMSTEPWWLFWPNRVWFSTAPSDTCRMKMQVLFSQESAVSCLCSEIPSTVSMTFLTISDQEQGSDRVVVSSIFLSPAFHLEFSSLQPKGYSDDVGWWCDASHFSELKFLYLSVPGQAIARLKLSVRTCWLHWMKDTVHKGPDV